MRILTFTSRDDAELAKVLSLLPALHTLQVDYCPIVGPDEDPSAWSKTESDSGDDGDSLKRTPSIYSIMHRDLRGDITSLMNTPFGKIRNLSLSSVFWDVTPDSSATQDDWSSLRNLSMVRVDAPPQGVAALLSHRSLTSLSLVAMDDMLAVLEEVAAVGPELQILLLTSDLARPPAPLPAMDEKTSEALIACITRCRHSLKVLQVNDPTFDLAGLPAMPALRHLHITQYSANGIPLEWLSEQQLKTVTIRFFLRDPQEISAQEAALLAKYQQTYVNPPTFRMNLCREYPMTPSLDYAWEYHLPDPILQTSEIPELYR